MLLEQEGGVVAPVLRKLGADPAAVRQALGPALEALPKVTTPAARRSPPAARASWSRSCAPPRSEMRELKDEYVSTEHLLLALAAHPGKAGDALRSAGATHDELLKALSEVRGGHRVTDQNPEDKYQALERYGRDLTEAAAAGQARPGDRPRRRDPPGDPGPRAAAPRTTPC